MYKCILVPIDLSHTEKGAATLEVANRLKDDDGQVVLVNVVADFPQYVSAEIPKDLLEKQKADSQAALERIANKTGAGCRVHVRTGRAPREILTTAQDVKADLIIVGSHQPGLEDYLLGSTAARVVRHATCSVLVMR